MTGISLQEIECGILTIRGQDVLVGATIVDLYGVTIKEVNQAVSNNPGKFPPVYIIELTKDETREVVKNFDHHTNFKFSAHLPRALTEKWSYILVNILDKAEDIQGGFMSRRYSSSSPLRNQARSKPDSVVKPRYRIAAEGYKWEANVLALDRSGR